MSLRDCIGKKALDKDRAVSKKDANEAQRIYDEYYADFGDANVAAEKTVAHLREAFGVKAQQAFLQSKVIKRIVDDMKSLSPSEMRAHAAGLIDPIGQRKINTPAAESIRKAVLADAHAKITDVIMKHKRTLGGRTQNKADLMEIVDEAFGLATKNEYAKLSNKVLQERFEVLRLRFNAVGGNIRKLERYGLPTNWTQDLVDLHTVDEFLNDAMDRVNWKNVEQRLGHVKNKRASLIKMRDAISTKGRKGKDPTDFEGLQSLANRRQEARFIEWKTGKDWAFMQEKYGTGSDPFNAILEHIDSMARDIGELEALGPNPAATIRTVQNILRDEAEMNKSLPASGKNGKNALLTQANWLPHLHEAYTGAAQTPGNPAFAKKMANGRAVLVSAQLGSAVLSAITDTWFSNMTARFVGIPSVGVLRKHIELFAQPGGEAHAQMMRAGLLSSVWTQQGAAQMRFLGEVPTSEWAKILSDGVIRGSGLSHWTQTGRWAFGWEFLGLMADESGRTFDQVKEPFRNTMIRYGISADEWDAIRATPLTTMEDAPFLFLTDIKADKLRTKAMSMVHAETEYAVPSTSLTGSATLRGKPGDPGGELLKSALMYKNFSITMYHTHIMRAMQQPTGAAKIKYWGNLMIGGTLMGAFAIQMKQMARGKTPQDMNDTKFWLAAAAQGGGLGIFGDFLFNNWSRFGASLGATVAGPGVAALQDIFSLVQTGVLSVAEGKNLIGVELIRNMGRYTPGGSLWYARLAYERMVLDQLQTLADPKFKQRWKNQERNMKKDRGQEYWLPRGQIIPSFGR